MSHREPLGPRRGLRAGIREIAEALGVSIGTVDRALHGRPDISPVTREKVLTVAKTLGYQPNLAARYLSSRKHIRIAVALPRKTESFWNLVREGINDAARPLENTGVRLLHHSYPHLGEGEVAVFEESLREDVNGLLIAPGEPEKLRALIAQAAERGIKTICVNTDAPQTARLAVVAVDPVTSGALVGELMGRFLRGEGPVLLVTGLLTTIDHARKVEGFENAVRELWPRMRISGVVEAHDEEGEAYDKCRRVLGSPAKVAGVYVSTSNSMAVLRAIDDEGLAGKVTVITTDLFPDLLPYIRSGKVAATIHQRPWTQGRIAFQALHRFLAEGLAPAPSIGLSPHIVMKSNVDLFLDRMSFGWDGRAGRAAESTIEGMALSAGAPKAPAQP